MDTARPSTTLVMMAATTASSICATSRVDHTGAEVTESYHHLSSSVAAVNRIDHAMMIRARAPAPSLHWKRLRRCRNATIGNTGATERVDTTGQG